MLIHRVKVQECASAAITEVEYKHCLNRIREYGRTIVRECFLSNAVQFLKAACNDTETGNF